MSASLPTAGRVAPTIRLWPCAAAVTASGSVESRIREVSRSLSSSGVLPPRREAMVTERPRSSAYRATRRPALPVPPIIRIFTCGHAQPEHLDEGEGLAEECPAEDCGDEG